MRSLKLIWLLLLTLALAASFARPHVHTGAPSTEDAVCTKCQARDNPAELGEGSVWVIVSRVSFMAPRPPVALPVESSRCLDRAPKQGPPAA